MTQRNTSSVEKAIAACARQVDRFEKIMDNMDEYEQAQADAHPSMVRRVYRGTIALTKKLHLYDRITNSGLFKLVANTGVFYALGRRK